MPSKLVFFTPYELWTGDNRMLGPRGKKCIFIHYLSHSKRYMFLEEHEDESVTEIKSRDVNFLEA